MMNNLNSVKELLSQRHSHYQLASEWVAPQAEVEQMLKEVLALVPSTSIRKASEWCYLLVRLTSSTGS